MTVVAYYLLKVIICSGILFMYYHFALRNKVFHQWNRFYLIAVVFLSVFLPLVQFTLPHSSENPGTTIQLLQVVQSADSYMEEVYVRNQQPIDIEYWVRIGYIVITIVILASLLLSVFKIYRILKKHKIQPVENIRFVSTNEKGTPFSFFRYIFWNDKIDIHSPTGQQIFQHELVHVKEAHTLDKLLLQVVLIFFWSNPFFWLIRRELHLIHEFIADQKSVSQHDTATLASMILQSVYPQQFTNITNPFFQSSIKRRLRMLTKIQNPRISYASRLLTLPLIAFIVLAFSFKTSNPANSFIPLDKEITVVIDAGHGKEAGKLSGAQADGVFEDNIVLSLAKKIKELNKNSKINFVLTRTSQEIIDLKKRVTIAEENNADLFISLHVAAADNNNKGSGMEVFVSNKGTSFQQHSETLASVLKEELSSVYATNPNIIKRGVGIWVLDKNICPSVLIECGYITTKKDREFITNEANQELVAKKIINAIERYATAIEQNKIMNTTVDTLPKNKEIHAVDVNKKSARITITYKDGTKETLTVDEAKKRKLIRENAQAINNNAVKKQDPNSRSMQINGADKPQYYVDGKKFTGDLNKLDPGKIHSVNVLKGESAVLKYGDDGKNGVVEINSKPENRDNIYDTIPQPVVKKTETSAESKE